VEATYSYLFTYGTTQLGVRPSHKVRVRQPVSHKFMAESSAEIFMDMMLEYNGEDCTIYQQIITRLVIKEIVITIGDNAFKDFEVLTA
jgi:hypothetical protein